MGQKRLRHADRRGGVDCHGLGKNCGIERAGVIRAEDSGAIDQHPPIAQPGRQLLDHRRRRSAIGKVAVEAFGRWQAGGQRLCIIAMLAIMDDDVPAFPGKAPRNRRADALGCAGDEDGGGHSAIEAQRARGGNWNFTSDRPKRPCEGW